MSPRASHHSLDGDADAHQERLVEVLDQYVAELEAGANPSASEVVARHPDLADELADCLEGVGAIHRAVDAAKRDAISSDLTIDGPIDQANRAPAPDGNVPSQVGDYAIRREIGRGGMGVVYEAEERALRRHVALKVLPFAAVLDQKQIARFRNEAQAAAQLHHPHIVPVFAIGQDRGVHYYAMQHIEGRSVGQAIDELRSQSERATPHADSCAETLDDAPPAPPAISPPSASLASGTTTPTLGPTLGPTHRSGGFFQAVAQLGADVADALHHAHDYGVVHRDVKPSNLLLDAAGKVWVTDFGLARIQSDIGMTATGDVVGTLRYMSPEQARGQADRIDGRTDVYGLGATLYELLTLRHAHRGEHRQSVLERIERVEPLRPRRLNAHVPPDLESIVLRAMEKDPGARYPSAAAMAEDLRRFQAGLPTVARPPGPLRIASRWLARRRKLVAGVAAASLAVAIVSVAGALGIWQEQQRTTAALREAEVHATRAEARFTQAREVVDRFGAHLSDRLAHVPGSEPLRRELLADTLAYYQAFLEQAAGEPSLRNAVAETRVKAAAAAERLGRVDEALALYDRATVELRALIAADAAPSSLRWFAIGATNRANLLASRGATTAALTAFDEAIRAARDLVSAEPTSVEAIDQLAAALVAKATMLIAAEPENAEELLAETIALVDRAGRQVGVDDRLTRRLAVAHSARSKALRESEPTGARRSAARAVSLLRDLVREHPEADSYRADLAMAHSNRATLAADLGKWREAVKAYNSAAAELQRLSDRAPQVPRHRSELAVAQANLAVAHARSGDEGASDAWFDKADENLDRLVTEHPGESRHLRQRAALWNNRGVALRDRGRLDEAAAAFDRSVLLERRRLAKLPSGTPTLLPLHYANHAQVLSRLGRLEEAARVETRRRELLAKLATRDSGQGSTP